MAGTPKFEDVIYDVRGRAAWIIIDRPKVYNAFRGQTLEELIQAFHLAANDKEVACVVLTGNPESNTARIAAGLGVSEFLAKPVEMDVLRATVARWLLADSEQDRLALASGQ